MAFFPVTSFWVCVGLQWAFSVQTLSEWGWEFLCDGGLGHLLGYSILCLFVLRYEISHQHTIHPHVTLERMAPYLYNSPRSTTAAHSKHVSCSWVPGFSLIISSLMYPRVLSQRSLSSPPPPLCISHLVSRQSWPLVFRPFVHNAF